MARRYDSSRRRRIAEETRQSILRAALKLHWQGITEYEPLAREAGCSLPTLRKHFPTKEALYRNCTRTFAETLTMPDLASLAEIANSTRRLEESVSELCRIHEAMFGYAWFAAHVRKNSPTLEAEMTAYEGLAYAVAKIITPENSPKASVVRGLLDFLTYRALRLSGGLPPHEARKELIATLRPLILGGKSSTRSTGR
jgi:AcrR family transcriptional regulator